MQENVLLRITHDDADKPCCCGETMQTHITVPPMVVWTDPVIEPFKHVAVKSDEVITTTKQNREFMARNGLVDANDIAPPTPEEHQKTLGQINASIEKISPTSEQSAKLKDQGLLDIIE
jgi:hypothetical protein